MALSSCFHYRPCTISQPTHSSTFPISILGSVNLTIYLAIGNKRSAKIRNSRRTEQQLKSQINQTHLLRASNSTRCSSFAREASYPQALAFQNSPNHCEPRKVGNADSGKHAAIP
ncbi:unnamed protein product [Lasius platythorax]|uniref:Uncharacterized protein n=1 Tax=Lasius platythorax TaxID=488582 RepID=A0AAV2PC61_9HYME